MQIGLRLEHFVADEQCDLPMFPAHVQIGTSLIAAVDPGIGKMPIGNAQLVLHDILQLHHNTLVVLNVRDNGANDRGTGA